MLRRVLTLVFVCCGLLSACAAPEFPAHQPGEADPASAKLVTADDIAVFEAVIAAYAEAGKVLGLAPPPPNDRRPLSPEEVASRSARRTLGMLSHTELPYGVPETSETGWFSVSEKPAGPVRIDSALVKDFADRNRVKTSLASFTPRSLRVQRTLDLRHHRDAVGWSLPGYSPARDAAMVHVSLYSQPHGGGGQLIYLERTGGTWKVVAQRLTWIS
jgi:hypothetical protein